MKRVLAGLLCALAMPGYAMTKVDVFSTEIVLSDEKNAETLAQSEGLEQVLVKASGSLQVKENPVVSKALRNSGQYLTQISSSQQDGQPSLKLSFNSRQVQSLLTQAGLPYWSPVRANILVWMVEEDRYQRQIAWEQAGLRSVASLQQLAEQRGLPLTIPVGDIEDVTSISAPDLWGGFVAPLSQSSSRYPVDAVLVLRVQHRQNSSSVRWTLYDQKPERIASEQATPLTGQASGALVTAFEQVVDEVTNHYADKSAVKVSDTSTQSVMARFVEVNNANDFFGLESLLKGLNSVASVDVMKIQGNSVQFRIHLLAAQADFERELSNFNQLKAIEAQWMPEPVEETVPETTLPESGEALQAEEGTEVLTEPQPLAAEPEPVQPELLYEWLR